MIQKQPLSFAAREETPPFSAPWEIRLFALTQALRAKGAIDGEDWRRSFGAALEQSDPCDISAEGYYLHWLRAFEDHVTERGLTDAPTINHYRRAWQAAAERTPHGSPIQLTDADLHG